MVRQAVTTNVGIVWKQARRSDAQCTPLAGWAMPGWYHVTAAALGGEPSDLQFELTTPAAATVTKTADPTQSPTSDRGCRSAHWVSTRAERSPAADSALRTAR